jgi:hypothetical protein
VVSRIERRAGEEHSLVMPAALCHRISVTPSPLKSPLAYHLASEPPERLDRAAVLRFRAAAEEAQRAVALLCAMMNELGIELPKVALPPPR